MILNRPPSGVWRPEISDQRCFMESLELMPVRVRITAILRKAIYSGEYKSGEELSLTEVAARLGVSRTPVREALRGKIVVSVVAGYTFGRYERILAEGTPHLSTIPNTPVSVGEGIVVCERRHSLSEEDYARITELLSKIGLVLTVDTELLDIAGTVGGCGPAFVCLFMEALADAAVKHGIARTDAYRMAGQMVAGTGRLLLESGLHPAQLKDAVCSPGGTTIVGVAELERRRFRGAVLDAIDAIERKE